MKLYLSKCCGLIKENRTAIGVFYFKRMEKIVCISLMAISVVHGIQHSSKLKQGYKQLILYITSF